MKRLKTIIKELYDLEADLKCYDNLFIEKTYREEQPNYCIRLKRIRDITNYEKEATKDGTNYT